MPWKADVFWKIPKMMNAGAEKLRHNLQKEGMQTAVRLSNGSSRYMI